jgi:autotransporter-associated beta strand protein
MNIHCLEPLKAARQRLSGRARRASGQPTGKPMKSSILEVMLGINRAKATLLWAALLCAALPARAQAPTYYWDTNGSNCGASDDGPPDGVWWSGSTNWTADSSGCSDTFAYPGRANIWFAATGGASWDPTMSYTVTIEGVAQVSDIDFGDYDCTLTNLGYGYLDKDTPYILVLQDGQIATIYSVITSAAGTSNGITKYAFGTLVLGGTNTYQGPTTIEGGILQLAAPQVLPKTSLLVLAAGDTRPADGYETTSRFAAGGYSQTLGPLLLTGPYSNLLHTIDFGQGASALVFSDSHTQNWGGITLHLANYKLGVNSLRFGTNSSGLTATQLGLIQFDSYLGVPGKIDANGFVTPVLPTLSIAASGSNSVKLTWNALSGRQYSLQSKTTPATTGWITNSDNIPATNITASFTDTMVTNGCRYYRVGLKPITYGN